MTGTSALRLALSQAREALREAKARRHETRRAFLQAQVAVLSARADLLAISAAFHESEIVGEQRRLNATNAEEVKL